MTKIAILLFIALATMSSAYAQEQKSAWLRAGLNMNYGTLRFEESAPEMLLDSKMGFHVGIVADIGINNFLYLQPGVMLTSKGAEINDEDEYESGSDTYYSYEYYKSTISISAYSIEIPLMLSLKAPLSDGLFLRAGAGPYIGFAFSGEFKTESESEYCYMNQCDYDSNSSSEDIYPSNKRRMLNGKSFYAGIAVGGGVEIQSFYIGVNYSHGLTNVLETSSRYEDEVLGYERSLGITFGYGF